MAESATVYLPRGQRARGHRRVPVALALVCVLQSYIGHNKCGNCGVLCRKFSTYTEKSTVYRFELKVEEFIMLLSSFCSLK